MLKERVGRVSEFVAAPHRVVAGGISIDPEVVAQLFAHRHGADKLQSLTPREGEVLAAMAEGLGNSAISARLYITSNAVHKHIRSIFSKLDLPPDDDSDRRVAAVLRYLEGTASLLGHPVQLELMTRRRHAPLRTIFLWKGP